MTDEQTRVEIIYQNLQTELIQMRQSLACDIQGSHNFQKRIDKLLHEKKQMELRIKTEAKLQNGEERLQSILSELLQVENSFELYKQFLDRRRTALTEKEAQVQRAYTRKWVRIAQLRHEAAIKVASKMISRFDLRFARETFDRMEKKVSLCEAEIYGSCFFDDVCFNFPTIARSVEASPLEALELVELKKLLVNLEVAAEDNHRVIQRGIAYEQILLSNAEALDEEAKDLEKQSMEFGYYQYADRKLVESRLYACWDMSIRLRKLVEGSRLCTSELTKMHANFARKEREIFNRIAELEPSNQKDSDNSEKDSDSRSGA